jgi:hypothetical protein
MHSCPSASAAQQMANRTIRDDRHSIAGSV